MKTKKKKISNVFSEKLTCPRCKGKKSRKSKNCFSCYWKFRPSPLDVNSVKKMYKSGMFIRQIGDKFGVSFSSVQRFMIKNKIKINSKQRGNQYGERNPSWRGDEATYTAFHNRVYRTRGKPKKCKKCKTAQGRIEWANMTGKYGDVWDYDQMCVFCHRRMDQRRKRDLGVGTAVHIPRKSTKKGKRHGNCR